MFGRQRIKSDVFIVQEANGMHVVKVYFEMKELSDMFKERLSESDREKFKDNLFVPVKIDVNDGDFTVEASFVTA